MKSEELTWFEPNTPDEIMTDAYFNYDIDSLYVLISGGNDSFCVLDYILTNPEHRKRFKGGVFTNTGVGSQITRKYVLDFFHQRNLPLFMTWPNHNERFLMVALRNGFAFPGNHGMWMGYLKQHSWYYFMKSRLKLGEKACFISGVRKKESHARDTIKGYTKKPIDINARQVFVKPFLYKNNTQMQEYKLVNNIKPSPVYSWANKSGECWCGSHTDPWDLKLLEKNDRLQFENIKYVEKMMKIVLEKLMKNTRSTFGDISNWHRLFTSKNKRVRESLTKRQKQMVCLTYYNKWGAFSSEEIQQQMTLDNFKPEGLEFEVNDDYCGESCNVVN